MPAETAQLKFSSCPECLNFSISESANLCNSCDENSDDNNNFISRDSYNFHKKIKDTATMSFQNELGETYRVITHSNGTMFVHGSMMEEDIAPVEQGMANIDLVFYGSSGTESKLLLKLCKDNKLIRPNIFIDSFEPPSNNPQVQKVTGKYGPMHEINYIDSETNEIVRVCPCCLNGMESSTFHAHHLIGKTATKNRKYWNSPYNLFNICSVCHSILHNSEGQKARFIHRSIRNIFQYLYGNEFFLEVYKNVPTWFNEEFVKVFIPMIERNDEQTKQIDETFKTEGMYQYLLYRGLHLRKYDWMSNYTFLQQPIIEALSTYKV